MDHYDFEIAKYLKMFLAQQLNSSLHDNASAECTLALKFKIVIFSPHQQKAGQSKDGRRIKVRERRPSPLPSRTLNFKATAAVTEVQGRFE